MLPGHFEGASEWRRSVGDSAVMAPDYAPAEVVEWAGSCERTRGPGGPAVPLKELAAVGTDTEGSAEVVE